VWPWKLQGCVKNTDDQDKQKSRSIMQVGIQSVYWNLEKAEKSFLLSDKGKNKAAQLLSCSREWKCL
jgi:hypothetical protein